MKKVSLIALFFLIGLFVYFVPAQAHAGSNFAGIAVVIHSNDEVTHLNNVAINLTADTNAFYTGGGSSRSCDSANTTKQGPFVNLNGTDAYYGRLAGLKTGGVYTYHGRTYDNPDGMIYYGNGVNSTSNGGGNGFGFACSCNPLLLSLTIPADRYVDLNHNQQFDNGEPYSGTYTLSIGGMSNDSTKYVYLYLGNLPTISVAISAKSTTTQTAGTSITAKVGDTVTVTQKLVHNGNGDAIGTAYMENHLNVIAQSSPPAATPANGSITTSGETINNIADSPENSINTITANTYRKWQFTNSGTYHIHSGSWTENFSFVIKDGTTVGTIIGNNFEAGLYPNHSATYWKSPANPLAIKIIGSGGGSLTCTVTPNSGSVPLAVTVTPSINNVAYSYNMNSAGTAINVGPYTGPFIYTYDTAGTYSIVAAGNVPCSPASVTVQDPTDGDGKEVIQ